MMNSPNISAKSGLPKQQEQTLTEQTSRSKHRYFANLWQRSSGVEIQRLIEAGATAGNQRVVI